MFAWHFAASLAASTILALSVQAQQEGQQEGGQCLLQRSRSKVHAHVSSADSKDPAHSFFGVFGEIDLLKEKSLSWTTNIGQDFHDCSGSRFKTNYSGTHSGLVGNNGLFLKVGNCAPNGTVPTFTQELSCGANATGCHMWCAPTWQSYHDMQDWGAFDERCRGWDGSFVSEDAVCVKMGKIFTWARVQLPEHKNQLALTYAITQSCTRWCSPLWVTIYDKSNWAKSYRWCINRKDDFGFCDDAENVANGTWHDKSFNITKFIHKHGYIADEFVLEFAVYSEFEDPEVMINSIKLSYVQEVHSPQMLIVESCGSLAACGSEHQCCRKGGNSRVDATCCPNDWTCCEDSCCPSNYKCTITDTGHTCEPSVGAVGVPELCGLTAAPVAPAAVAPAAPFAPAAVAPAATNSCQDITYFKITSGKCSDYGYSPISSLSMCEAAAEALAIPDDTIDDQDFTKPGRPEGCYTKEDKMYLNTYSGSMGNGVQRTRYPLCSGCLTVTTEKPTST